MYRCYTVPVRRRLDQSSVCNYVCSGCAVQFSNLKLICSCSCSPIHCSSVDTIAASLCSVCCVEWDLVGGIVNIPSVLYSKVWSLHNKLMVLFLVLSKCINFVDLWLWQVMWNASNSPWYSVPHLWGSWVLVVIRVKKLTMLLNWLLYRVCVKNSLPCKTSSRCWSRSCHHLKISPLLMQAPLSDDDISLSLGKNLPLLITPFN